MPDWLLVYLGVGALLVAAATFDPKFEFVVRGHLAHVLAGLVLFVLLWPLAFLQRGE